MMDLNAFKRKTIADAALGEVDFAESNWHLKVEIPGKGRFLLNLTGEFNRPLWRADDDIAANEACNCLTDGFSWHVEGDIVTGPQASPRHLSVVVTESGPAVAAAIDAQYMFFLFDGHKIAPSTRGSLAFINWSIYVRDVPGSRSWPLLRVGPPAGNS